MSEKQPLSIANSYNLDKGLVNTVANPSDRVKDNFQADQHTIVYKEWTPLFQQEKVKLDLSIEHSYTVTFDVKLPKSADLEDDLDTARVFMGIKHPQKEYQDCIEIGVYMGRIYMRDLFDVVNIPKEKLVEGVKLILAVSPLPDYGRCASTLTVKDLNGEVISAIKTSRILKKDWMGGISPGLHIKSFSIEGVPA